MNTYKLDDVERTLLQCTHISLIKLPPKIPSLVYVVISEPIEFEWPGYPVMVAITGWETQWLGTDGSLVSTPTIHYKPIEGKLKLDTELAPGGLARVLRSIPIGSTVLSVGRIDPDAMVDAVLFGHGLTQSKTALEDVTAGAHHPDTLVNRGNLVVVPARSCDAAEPTGPAVRSMLCLMPGKTGVALAWYYGMPALSRVHLDGIWTCATLQDWMAYAATAGCGRTDDPRGAVLKWCSANVTSDRLSSLKHLYGSII